MGQSLPVAVRMVKQEGEMYALDADKSFDVKSDLNILRDYVRLLLICSRDTRGCG